MKTTASLLLLGLLAGGCHGDLSRDPPVHLNPNMDNVERFDPQEPNPYFKDGRAMRPQVPGTVAVGELKHSDHMQRGTLGGQPARVLPVKLDRELLERGQARYDIYCAPCHDRTGTSNGIVVQRGLVPPPSLHDPRIRAMPVGEIYKVISEGVRNMPSYAAQIPVHDRWAITAYVRALQVARNAKLSDVPRDIAESKGFKP
jgi:mono/diheme cytochrome c family protein